jgi:hypothetical protein
MLHVGRMDVLRTAVQSQQNESAQDQRSSLQEEDSLTLGGHLTATAPLRVLFQRVARTFTRHILIVTSFSHGPFVTSRLDPEQLNLAG